MFALILSRVCVCVGGENTFIMECLILVRLFLSLRTRAVGLAEEKGGVCFPNIQHTQVFLFEEAKSKKC